MWLWNKMSQVMSYYHTERVLVKAKMEEGGCLEQFHDARKRCETSRLKGTGGDVRKCMNATARLRRCMQCNEAHFRTCIRDMEEGLDHDDNAMTRWFMSLNLDSDKRWKWRWSTGMIRP